MKRVVLVGVVHVAVVEVHVPGVGRVVRVGRGRPGVERSGCPLRLFPHASLTTGVQTRGPGPTVVGEDPLVPRPHYRALARRKISQARSSSAALTLMTCVEPALSPST